MGTEGRELSEGALPAGEEGGYVRMLICCIKQVGTMGWFFTRRKIQCKWQLWGAALTGTLSEEGQVITTQARGITWVRWAGLEKASNNPNNKFIMKTF